MRRFLTEMHSWYVFAVDMNIPTRLLRTMAVADDILFGEKQD